MADRKPFKRRNTPPKRNIERATAFKVDYLCLSLDKDQKRSREFKTIKSLSQWIDRNDIDTNWDMLILKKLALIDETWEPFTTIGKKTITLSDLTAIVEDLKTSVEGK